MKTIPKFLVSVMVAFSLVPVPSYAATYFSIDDNGNVGIGSTTPQSKLDVTGSIYSRLVNLTDTASTTVDWNSANIQELTLNTSATTLAFSNGQAGGEYKIILTQDGTGSRTVTWPTNVEWPGGTAPSLSTAASSTDLVSFVYDGTNYLGSASLNYKHASSPTIAFQGSAGVFSTSSGGVATHAFDLSAAGSHVTLIASLCRSTTGLTITSVTWNGTAMSMIGTSTTHPQCPGGLDNWALPDAAAVNGNLVVNLSGGNDSIGEGLVWYSGTSSSFPDAVVDHASATTSSVSQSITTSHDNSWAVIIDQQNAGTPSAGANTTLRETTIATIGDSGAPIHPAGTATLNINFGASSQNTYWVVSIAPR